MTIKLLKITNFLGSLFSFFYGIGCSIINMDKYYPEVNGGYPKDGLKHLKKGNHDTVKF